MWQFVSHLNVRENRIAFFLPLLSNIYLKTLNIVIMAENRIFCISIFGKMQYSMGDIFFKVCVYYKY